MESLIPNNKTDLMVSLREVTQELNDEIQNTPPEDASLPPVEGEWSVKEIMGHLADAEQIWNERFKRIIEEDEPFLRAFNPDELAQEHDYKGAEWQEVVKTFEAWRQANLTFLDQLDLAQWLKGGIHQERGHVTITDLAESLLSHTQTHIEQIRHTRWLAK